MSPDEFRAARAELGLTAFAFGRAFKITDRTVRNWETGFAPIPHAAAVLIRLALRYAHVRKELGIGAKRDQDKSAAAG